MSRESLRAALETIGKQFCKCTKHRYTSLILHDDWCPRRIAALALAAEAAEPVRRALPDTVRCPTHCTLPDTGDVRLCPCTGECERCNELRNVDPAAAPPEVESAREVAELAADGRTNPRLLAELMAAISQRDQARDAIHAAALLEETTKAHDEYVRGVETGKKMRLGLATEIERLRTKLAEAERERDELRWRLDGLSK